MFCVWFQAVSRPISFPLLRSPLFSFYLRHTSCLSIKISFWFNSLNRKIHVYLYATETTTHKKVRAWYRKILFNSMCVTANKRRSIAINWIMHSFLSTNGNRTFYVCFCCSPSKITNKINPKSFANVNWKFVCSCGLTFPNLRNANEPDNFVKIEVNKFPIWNRIYIVQRLDLYVFGEIGVKTNFDSFCSFIFWFKTIQFFFLIQFDLHDLCFSQILCVVKLTWFAIAKLFQLKKKNDDEKLANVCVFHVAVYVREGKTSTSQPS